MSTINTSSLSDHLPPALTADYLHSMKTSEPKAQQISTLFWATSFQCPAFSASIQISPLRRRFDSRVVCVQISSCFSSCVGCFVGSVVHLEFLKAVSVDGNFIQTSRVIQLVEEVTQLAVPQEVVECPSSMPPRRRGRGRGQFQESGGQNEDQYSAPSHTHESSEEGEAEAPPAPVERMDVVIARFQRMNPPVLMAKSRVRMLIHGSITSFIFLIGLSMTMDSG
ncbi:hypothetical protein F511_17986 [Dorcoceras hygrometricum]|uniref:Uncharacterized protein n=1 Tax=Dorcoceras hygrometricum TaxID=472368 RepID=A0A2Z7C3Q4_9LAMI|nr:hypothetical protein F511_17986 [Dorcoceras hygrometricum]